MNRYVVTALGIAAILVVCVLGVRFFSGPEDVWLCEEGQWIKYGSPSTPAPAEGCGDNSSEQSPPVVNQEDGNRETAPSTASDALEMDNGNELIKYTNRELGFSFSYPKRWGGTVFEDAFSYYLGDRYQAYKTYIDETGYTASSGWTWIISFSDFDKLTIQISSDQGEPYTPGAIPPGVDINKDLYSHIYYFDWPDVALDEIDPESPLVIEKQNGYAVLISEDPHTSIYSILMPVPLRKGDYGGLVFVYEAKLYCGRTTDGNMEELISVRKSCDSKINQEELQTIINVVKTVEG